MPSLPASRGETALCATESERKARGHKEHAAFFDKLRTGMAETVAYLMAHVIARVPVCQWVLSFPVPPKSLFMVYPVLLTAVLRIVHRAIHA